MSDVQIGLVHDFNSVQTSGGPTFDHEDSNFGGGTPKGVLHLHSRSTVLNTPAAHFAMSIGAAKSATTGELFTMHTASQSGSPDTVTYGDQREVLASYLGVPFQAENSRDGHHDFSAFGTNKITYTVGNTYDGNYGLITLLLGGADLNVDVGVFDISNNSVDDEEAIVTGFDMSNSVVLLFSTHQEWQIESADTSPSTLQSVWGMGTYDGTTFRQACMSLVEVNASAEGDPTAHLSDGRIIQASGGATGSALHAQEWTSVDTTSGGRFILTTRNEDVVSPVKYGYIAIGLPSDWKATVSVEDTPTGTISNPYTFSPAGGAGWTPKLLIQFLTLMEAVDTGKVDNEAGGIGCRIVIGTGSDDEYCVAGNIEDAAPGTDTEIGIHDSGFINEDDGTTGFEMDLNAFVSGGWEDNFVNVMGNAKKVISLTIGENDSFIAATNTSLNDVVQRRPIKVTSY